MLEPGTLEIVNSLGIMGILLIQVWWFVQGRIVSRETVDQITKNVANEIICEIEESVRKGFVAAWYEINGGRRDEDVPGG